MPESCKVYITGQPPTSADQGGAQGEVLTVDDSDPQRALQAIIERRPDVITLDHEFAASPRGVALIDRLKDDPLLAGSEIFVQLADGNLYRFTPGGQSAPVPGAPPRQEPGKTRRAPRVPIRPGTQVLLDGREVSLVDLSVLGAQVLSPTIVRPNAAVRVVLPEEEKKQLKVNGVVVWARFELSGTEPGPRYRAGIAFLDPDPVAVLRYCGQHRA